MWEQVHMQVFVSQELRSLMAVMAGEHRKRDFCLHHEHNEAAGKMKRFPRLS